MNEPVAPPVTPPEQRELFALAGRRVLVLGLGESGLAMAHWVGAQGGHLRVAETRSADGEDLPQLALLREHCPGLEFRGGAFDDSWLDGMDLVAWSPGLSIETGPSARFYQSARERGLPVLGELDLFVQALAGLRESGYQPRIVAITGTNGKTTTTALTAQLISGAGKRARAAGNIGPAMLAALLEAVRADALPDVWVLELSSFQLAVSGGFEPDAAVILNVSEDHLDWHASMADYLAAKRRILGRHSWVVWNRSDPATAPDACAAPVLAPSRGARRLPPPPPLRASSFGLDAPVRAGDFGIVQDGALAWLAVAQAPEPEPGARRRVEEGDLTVRRLMPADALRLVGRHNHANVMAALALGVSIGTPLAPMLRGLRDYTGEPHRCQPVAVINGVSWIDDSKGTNVGASVAALQGIGQPCVLIAGGEGKGQDFSRLSDAVKRHARYVLLIGRDASVIQAALTATGVPIELSASLDSAVDRAAALARSGEAVLLSPACASFDMFRNYGHRGDVFAQAVRALGERLGQPVELAC